MLQILLRIEKWESKSEKDSANRKPNPNQRPDQGGRCKGRGKGHKGNSKVNKENDKGANSNPKNPCKLPDHSKNEWSACFYNFKSKKIKGAARSLRDYNEDGSLKKKGAENNCICPKIPSKRKTICWYNESSDSGKLNALRREVLSKEENIKGAEILLCIPVKRDLKRI